MGPSSLIVVDTSALIAVILEEPQHQAIRDVLERDVCAVPSPVIVEFASVSSGTRLDLSTIGDRFIGRLLQENRFRVADFDLESAKAARSALPKYGKGRRNRAQLNIVDLMVYGIAKRLEAPILCTGQDFAETDALIHPASRLS